MKDAVTIKLLCQVLTFIEKYHPKHPLPLHTFCMINMTPTKHITNIIN